MRIVSLLPGVTEMLYALDLGKQVVGVSHECDFPADARTKPRVTVSHIDSAQSSRAIDDQVRAHLSAGSALYSVNIEQLVTLRPDVILTQAQCDVCAVKYTDVLSVVAQSPELGQAKVVPHNPSRLSDLFSDLNTVGRVCDCESHALALIEQLQTRLATISTLVARLSHPRVACVEWLSPLMLAANWVPDLIEAGGGENGLTQPGVHSQYADWSVIREYDPEVLLIAPCGFDLVRALAEWSQLEKPDGWPQLSAVRNNRVFAIDGNALFNRFGPRLIDTVELLARLFHPDLIARLPLGDDLNSAWAMLDPQAELPLATKSM